MSVTLNLNPDVEKGLLALAQERGLSLTEYLQEIMTREAARSAAKSSSTGEETAKAFLAWADSFPDTPPLSDEAISRETMYPDRW
jgi:hypothetical protein